MRGRGLIAGMLSFTALWAAPVAQASHPACPEWGEGLAAYPYGFQGIEFNLPECRLAARGMPDVGTHALLPQRINMRRALGFLEPNAGAGGRVRWPLVDSFGRPLAILERHADRWETTDPDTGTVIYRDLTLSDEQFTVQGRGCMVDDALESTHALVAFNALDRSTLPEGATIVPFQLRAFIARDALPAANESGTPIRAEVDLHSAGCGTKATAPAPAGEVDDPNFDSNEEQFYGQDGIARSYATYNVKHKYANARYFTIDSTGVGGGGIVRGIVRAADPVEAADGFGYCDPNHLRSMPRPAATWRYGRIAGTRMAGWFATRCTDGEPGPIPGGTAAEAPVAAEPAVPGPAPVALASGLRASTAAAACRRARVGRASAMRTLRRAALRLRRARPGAQRRRLARPLGSARRRAAERLAAVRRLC